ncbi:ABC transporter permease [Methylicorpusculum sp.]|uniref:ABC transporter permease n=1 Tax=Methylicorpusculum sp. TaxID=2713644 RepID=UPI002ABB5D27|nr:ABC transporter permease [Methylicorpusculum sp.]MDZ4153921.1 ABC transporter permease [Methylicorpusculum sp.]
MIKFSIRPCAAVIVRHLLEFKNAFEVFMVTYWCFFDLFSFGLLATSFKQPNALQHITTNIALWYFVARGSIGFAVSFVRDLHNVNFVSMMTTPLTLSEWFVSLIAMGIVNGLLGFLVTALWAALLFDVNVFSIGWVIIPAAISLLCSGCVLGTLVLSIVLTFGRRAESFVWIAGYFLAPFSGVFCPVASLPVILQKIAAWLPTSYVFACFGAGRSGQVLTTSQLLLKSFALNGFYCALALALFHWRFTRCRSTGLTRLEVEL